MGKLQYLSTGGEDHFLPKLVQAINRAANIDITVAFIRQTGLALMMEPLQEALAREVKVRILTGDYLQITDPPALQNLLLLQELGAEVKVFESGGSHSFHMKAYIFIDDQDHQGCAFVGSSNITRSALQHGLEWNLRVDQLENPAGFAEIREQFELVFNLEQNVHLTQNWLAAYQLRYQAAGPAFAAMAPGADEELEVVAPNVIQQEALVALQAIRAQGARRGLVVLATGMGKTWLSAFDSRELQAKRILFVAHREEILLQAEATFVRIFPGIKVGRYTGKEKQLDADMLFAAVQTLGRQKHLDQFPSDYFDYIVVDEFHHAAARTYQQLLVHFKPQFLLGLTATPERTDQADILALCDGNLVFRRDLFEGIRQEILSPFSYYGIGDETVNYQEISWRNSKFDTQQLMHQLATLARGNHAFKQWRKYKQSRTLAFCISLKHADFMADHFVRQGVKALSVHSKSTVRRNEALRQLESGETEVIFSVDLFNEGVDLPAIDTVLMLRPTESKIIFLQQLGRGMRRCEGKEKLVVIDFIGNHQSFFNKPDALFQIGSSNRERKDFLEKAKNGTLDLPEGCFVNYDLTAIDFMAQLTRSRVDLQVDLYESLKASLGHRPSLAAFYRAGGGIPAIRKEYGQWLLFVEKQGDLSEPERACLKSHQAFFEKLETTRLSKSFKLILLEALLELNGFQYSPEIKTLEQKSFEVLQARKNLWGDLKEKYPSINLLNAELPNGWHKYWQDNPIKAWIGGNSSTAVSFFKKIEGKFLYKAEIDPIFLDCFNVMVQEIVNYRFLQYEERSSQTLQAKAATAEALPLLDEQRITIPYFSDLRIACGHFRSSTHDLEAVRLPQVPAPFDNLDPAKHFIARASGHSMNGGQHPIQDGDYLLLEAIAPDNTEPVSNQIVAIERTVTSGDNQYLLRTLREQEPGQYQLLAQNPDYKPMQATEEMRTFARFKGVVDAAELHLHQRFMREQIPHLFGMEFKPGAWNSGYVSPKGHHDQYLLVTLNKSGKAVEHQYHDYFIDNKTFHWQSQNSTSPSVSKGRAIINHLVDGSKVYLFVRKHKLEGGKGSPFYYCGRVTYKKHEGEKPMNVVWELDMALNGELERELLG
ncbi:MAG: helicase [SAR324 cluster bacterium]|uniref:Helicase n=1 Tax=SAR324 cluster bacterium TaxID=2024889 RepID=A0A2A4T540_9DELT|nr:MAG: helicase [SAR324 cluster bacterium]